MAKVIATERGYFGKELRDVGARFDVPDEIWNDKKRRPKWAKRDPAHAFGGKGDHDGDGSVGGSKPGEGIDFSKMKVDELREFAASNGVDLGEATKKADIIAILNGGNVGNTTDAPKSEPFADNGAPIHVKNEVNEATGATEPDWIKPSGNAPVMADE